MFAAELAGKVTADKPPHERMEDVLTSNVFTSFRYLNNSELLTNFLCRAVDANGNNLSFGNIVDFEIVFWPKFRFENTGYREPDVLIIAQSDDEKKIVIVVEAKLDSGLSNVEEPNTAETKENNTDGFLLGHQLADQFCGLECGEWVSEKNARAMAEAEEKYLLFLTAHHSMPKDDLREAMAEVVKRRACQICKWESCDTANRLYWLNWQALHQVIEKWEDPRITAEAKGQNHLLADLKCSLEQKKLRPLQIWQTELVQVDAYERGEVQLGIRSVSIWFDKDRLAQVDGYQEQYRNLEQENLYTG